MIETKHLVLKKALVPGLESIESAGKSISLINCHKHFFFHCHEIHVIVTPNGKVLKFLQWSKGLVKCFKGPSLIPVHCKENPFWF